MVEATPVDPSAISNIPKVAEEEEDDDDDDRFLDQYRKMRLQEMQVSHLS